MESSSEDAPHKLKTDYQFLFERNPFPMWVYDINTLRILAVNDAALSLYGYSRQAFLALTVSCLHREDDWTQVQAHLKRPLGIQPDRSLWQHKLSNGELIEVATSMEALEFEGAHARAVAVEDRTELHHMEQSLCDLNHRLTTTLESITDALLTIDREWRYTYVNARAEQVLHKKREELLGATVWEKFPEAVGGIFEREYQRAMDESVTVSFETFYPPLGIWLAVNAYPSVQGLAIYFRDVTERHLAEQRLREEQEVLTAVVNATTDAVISTDLEGVVRMFNPAAERIFRRSRADMLGQSIELLMPERFRAVHEEQRQRFAESGESTRMMGLGLVKGLRSDGQELDMEANISRVKVIERTILIVNLRDVTERVSLDAEFQQSRAQLSELTQRLMNQENMLVKRLAQALHDQLGQTMAAIRMSHETIVALQKGATPPMPPSVDRMQTQMGALIGQAVRQVRQVLIDLRPPLLEEHGLAAALDNELRNRALTHPLLDIAITIKPEIASMRWPPDVEYAAFMIAREALENVFRHSLASLVHVILYGSAQSLHLDVEDDGVGGATGLIPKTGHLGILGMQERAHAAGATLNIEPRDIKGTRVSFSWQPTS